ncbi:transforming growth factor-beta-induced protein ig-h3-like [Uloborus diversus]|uniref:transforming growth factor-beta-induced protein ig-h3-like n=1 Tax=Uloborus diversus TaxID=327109 RepID=UPI002409B300|nr:transforming growth factor-beta-induced protein ig-h3-like [Uloborus diversus]
MRFAIVSAIVCGVLFVSVCGEDENKNRRKRFINADAFRILPDSFLRIGDIARELTDGLSSQTAMVFQQAVPEVTKSLSGRGRQTPFRRQEEERDEKPKRGLVRVPIERERETEGDEDEIETFNPVQTPETTPAQGETDVHFNPFIPFSFSFGLLRPWWNGPNVCEERSEVEEPEAESTDLSGIIGFNFQSTQCVPSDSSYVCTKKIQTNGMRKTIISRRQCCHGYVRRTDGRPGCSALKMENLIDTIKTLEMKKFLRWIETSELQEQLQTDNFTVFTPANEAVIDFEDDTEDNEISAINPAKFTDVTSVVLSHIVPGYKNVDSLENEQLLETLDEESKIRINKYHTSQAVTANCIPISGKNNFATNGIVHLVSGVLPKASRSLGNMLEEDGQFNTMKRLLEKNGILEDLKNSDQAWTVFVPTDEAFRKLPRGMLRQIESGEGCVQSILLEHLVKQTVCTSAVVSQVRVKNMLENNLKLTKDETEKLRVNGALLETENKVGTNGVIHVIDKVLIPPQARSLLKALEEEERTDMLDLIETAELMAELEKMENVTFFVPSKEALMSLSNETLLELQSDKDIARAVILGHLIQPHTPTSMFKDNKRFKTMGGHEVHLKLHEMFPGLVTAATVQCAYVMSHDNQACGAIFHKINKVLMPPKGSILQTLKGMEGHDILIKLLQDTELLTKLDEEGPFTFLAPTDEAFEKLDDITLEELLENKTKAEEILRLHVLPEVLCCNSVNHASPLHRQYVRTLEGNIMPLHRSLNDKVRFGRARAVQCDISATNGLIHSINRVILPRRPTYSLLGLDFWDFF